MLANLSRAGKRLMGFCRTNLFKRLESSGQAFLQSIERHILRNYVFLHAIENGLPLPIGTQDAELLDARAHDEDADRVDAVQSLFDQNVDQEDSPQTDEPETFGHIRTASSERAEEIYETYAGQYRGV